MELIFKQGRHWQEFSSVTDLINFITDPKYHNPDAPTASHDGDMEWTGSGSFPEAINLARKGWPEGLAEIVRFVIKVEKLVMSYIPEPTTKFDVVGDVIDMGRFIEGDPECMVSLVDGQNTKKIAQGKIVHVVLNIDAAGSSDIYTFFRRGAAGVALIDALERTGRRVIADAIANTVSRSRLLETRIRVKNADEHIQLDKLAFLFAHPSILRRILFAAWERLPNDVRKLYGFHGSWGYGCVGHVPKEDQGDLYVDRLVGSYHKTEEEVTQYVLEQLKSQGVVIKED